MSLSLLAIAATRRAVFTRARFINGQRASLKLLFMKLSDCLGGIFLCPHFDEGKPTRTAGGAILHDIHCEHRTDLGKVVLQIVLGCGEGEVPYE